MIVEVGAAVWLRCCHNVPLRRLPRFPCTSPTGRLALSNLA